MRLKIYVGVSGSRGFDPPKRVFDYFTELFEYFHDETLFYPVLVHGGAKGVDTAAFIAAERLDVKTIAYLPDYDKYGKGAPFVRNGLIAEKCNFLIAFWDGRSTGTLDTIKKAAMRDRSVYINPPQGFVPFLNS